MPAEIVLTVTQGPLLGSVFTFAERTTCLVGRGEDCNPRLPNDEAHHTVSRHHCLLDLNPPEVRVWDFGSLNGTFVNGRLIGRRLEQAPGTMKTELPEVDLVDGDLLQVGGTVFLITVSAPVRCFTCEAEIPAHQKAQAERIPGLGLFICPQCRGEPGANEPTIAQRPAARCAGCGGAVVRGARRGEMLCSACRAQPAALVRTLLRTVGDGAAPGFHGYEVVRELGRGGMGLVYLVRQVATGELAALKVMLPAVAAEPWARERFLREVDNARALDHPNLVRLRDACFRHGAFFFTLDYCDGGSVAELIRQRGGKLPTDEALEIIDQVLAGLDYAHNAALPCPAQADGEVRGLVHRDLKPGNIFLTGPGREQRPQRETQAYPRTVSRNDKCRERRARIGDYGLAKAFDTAGLSGHTRTGDRGGTPEYMPRQQVVNFKYAQPAVDVWAAAASLYSMLTGTTPRDFPPDRDHWRVVLETAAVPIRERQTAVPPRLAEVIDLALVDRPGLQFETAREFREALRAARAGQ
jgi:serine/threonine-protein kinase